MTDLASSSLATLDRDLRSLRQLRRRHEDDDGRAALLCPRRRCDRCRHPPAQVDDETGRR